MYSFDFSYSEYERIFDRCVFSDVELQIIQAKRKSRSNVQIAQDLNIAVYASTQNEAERRIYFDMLEKLNKK